MGVSGAKMNLPGETEAGNAGMQPRRGIAGGTHRADVFTAREHILSRCVYTDKKTSDDRPRCLENPRPEGAESTLTENAAPPFPAKPRQACKCSAFSFWPRHLGDR